MTFVSISSQPKSISTDNQKLEPPKVSASNNLLHQDEVTNQKPSSGTVNISGRAVMLSRLFHADGAADPKVETATTTSNVSGSVYSFLTNADRDTVSKLYEFANANGIAPEKIDDIAFDIGHYRMAGPGGPQDTTGSLYDLDGNPFISAFNSKDEAIAQKTLTSKAMSDTLFDSGFLKSVFNPGRTPVHASDFVILEKAVYAFSATGSDGATDPNASPVVRPKKEDFKPLKLPPNETEAGNSTVLSRLLGVGADKSGNLANNFKITSHFASFLNDDDKDMLGRLYAVAQSRNESLSKIDHIAISLGRYRMISQFFE